MGAKGHNTTDLLIRDSGFIQPVKQRRNDAIRRCQSSIVIADDNHPVTWLDPFSQWGLVYGMIQGIIYSSRQVA